MASSVAKGDITAITGFAGESHLNTLADQFETLAALARARRIELIGTRNNEPRPQERSNAVAEIALRLPATITF